MAKVSNKLDYLKLFLGEIPSVNIAIVYGSYANGSDTPKSDFDLGLAASRPFGDDEFADLHNRISQFLGLDLDLVDLNRATGTVFKQILTTGNFLVVKDTNLLARISSRMIFDEQDFQSKRREMMSLIRKDVFDGK